MKRVVGYIVVILVVLSSYPFLAGQMYGTPKAGPDIRLRTLEFPSEYHDIEKKMAELAEDGSFKVLYLPTGGSLSLLNDRRFRGAFREISDIYGNFSPLPGALNISDKGIGGAEVFASILKSNIYSSGSSYLPGLLRLSNVRYVVIRLQTRFGSPEQPSMEEIVYMLDRHEGFTKVYDKGSIVVFENTQALPHIYASAAETTNIYSSINTLLPLTETAYVDGSPVLVFLEQQRNESLPVLLGAGKVRVGDSVGGAEEKPVGSGQDINGNPILFANSNFHDLVIDLAKYDSQSKGISRIVSNGAATPKPVFIELAGQNRAEFKVVEGGMYEVWTGINGKLVKRVEALEVGGDRYSTAKIKRTEKWSKVGDKKFAKGTQHIQLVSKEVAGSGSADLLRASVMILSKDRRKEYEQFLKSKSIGYFFNKTKVELKNSRLSKVISKRDFYIGSGGEYEVTASVRPLGERVRAYALNEEFKKSISGRWNLRLPKLKEPKSQKIIITVLEGAGKAVTGREVRLKEEGARVKSRRPVFTFGENFYSPQPLSGLQYKGLWRRMSNDGKVLIFNPLIRPVKVDISFTMASFKNEKEVRVFLNNRELSTFALSGPVEDRWWRPRNFEGAFGKPKRIELRDVVLSPGVNNILFETSPSAILSRKYLVSVVLGDNFSVMEAGQSAVSTNKQRESNNAGNVIETNGVWSNNKEFYGKVKVEDNVLTLRDDYRLKADEVAWVTRGVDKVAVNDYPLFILEYSWPDNRVQSMDVGFRFDRDGDGKGELYFVRTLPDAVLGINRFEVDLLGELRKVFLDTVTGTENLVGIDLFPHKRWGMDLSESINEGVYDYLIKGVQVVSKEGSVVTVLEDNFDQLKFSGKGTYHIVGKQRKNLMIPVRLDGRKDIPKFSVPLKPALQNRSSSLVVVPFKVTDKDVQRIGVLAGYDTSGDAKADTFLPVGRKVNLLNWKRIEEDTKKYGFIYEAKLPPDYPVEYTTAGKVFNNIVVLKDGEPLVPTWNNEFNTGAGQVQVDGGRVVIALPGDKLPESFDYSLYYMPKQWVKSSLKFPGFKEYVFELDELRAALAGDATLLELKFVLEERLLEGVERSKEYNYYFKAPIYSNIVIPSLDTIKLESNMPLVTLDQKALEFDRKEVSRADGNYLFKIKVSLNEGEHRLSVHESGALEVYIAEIKPVMAQHLEAVNHNPPGIEFKKVNPTRYVVDVKGASGAFNLIFNDSFSEGWKAYIRPLKKGGGSAAAEARKAEPWSALWSAWSERGSRFEVKDHFVVNGYANGWRVPVGQSTGQVTGAGEDEVRNFSIILEYKPQRLFELGLLIATTVFIGCLLFLGYRFLNRRLRNDCRE